MSTWAELLADIRADLKDEGDSPKWEDSSLFVWVKDAIRNYSLHFPQELEATLEEEDGKYPLPLDYITNLYVMSPEGRYIEERITQPGVWYGTLNARPTLYYIRGTNLYLNGSPGTDEVILIYLAQHVVPDNADDGSCEMTVPEQDEELIRLFVKAKAIEQFRTKQANLDRFRPGSMKRTDNPLLPETTSLMDEYHIRIAERYPGGVIKLYRVGRRYS